MMHIQHTVEIWLDGQHSVQSTAIRLVDIGRTLNINMPDHKHAVLPSAAAAAAAAAVCDMHAAWVMWYTLQFLIISSGVVCLENYKKIVYVVFMLQ